MSDGADAEIVRASDRMDHSQILFRAILDVMHEEPGSAKQYERLLLLEALLAPQVDDPYRTEREEAWRTYATTARDLTAQRNFQVGLLAALMRLMARRGKLGEEYVRM